MRPSPPSLVRDPFLLGIDFGTLSGRLLLVSGRTGEIAGERVRSYRHGVITASLPGSKRPLRPDSALQHPDDYLEVLSEAPALLRKAGVRPAQVAGIGIDFTASTILPVRADGVPLCRLKRFARKPDAWVKLWKHHAAKAESEWITRLARERREAFLRSYGGSYSCEWMIAKILETARNDPAVYEAADQFMEAGDWVVWQLCGEPVRSVSAAGFKAMRVCGRGSRVTFPSVEFLAAVHPRFRTLLPKLEGRFAPPGTAAGGLTESAARRMGLPPGIPVGVAHIDAHAAVPACTVTGPGQLVVILGTSACHLLADDRRVEAEGICGVVRDGVLPGYWGYEAGQAAVGDMFGWFAEHATPPSVHRAARTAGISVQAWLEREAARVPPGARGLLALDWWNGNRSVLMDAGLSGLIAGFRLSTRPPDLYRALLESAALGTARILEAFERKGLQVREVYACGGIAHKSPLLLQILADVTRRPIRRAATEHASALGSAIFAAVASGVHRSLESAAGAMARLDRTPYLPRASAAPAYARLEALHRAWHDLLGRRHAALLHALHPS